MSFATRSIAAAILVLALIHYTVYLNGEFVDGTVGAWTRSVMYGVNGTNRIEVRAIDAAGNQSAAAVVVVELQL